MLGMKRMTGTSINHFIRAYHVACDMSHLCCCVHVLHVIVFRRMHTPFTQNRAKERMTRSPSLNLPLESISTSPQPTTYFDSFPCCSILQGDRPLRMFTSDSLRYFHSRIIAPVHDRRWIHVPALYHDAPRLFDQTKRHPRSSIQLWSIILEYIF